MRPFRQMAEDCFPGGKSRGRKKQCRRGSVSRSSRKDGAPEEWGKLRAEWKEELISGRVSECISERVAERVAARVAARAAGCVVQDFVAAKSGECGFFQVSFYGEAGDEAEPAADEAEPAAEGEGGRKRRF